MSLNLNDPLTWVGIISTLILGSIVIVTIGKVFKSVMEKLPTLKKAGPVEFMDGSSSIEEVITQLKVRIAGLESEDNQLKARVFLLESVHRDSIGFKQRARKMAIRFEDLLRSAYLVLAEEVPGLSKELAPRLDEVIIFKKTTAIIRKDILLKALDDLDNNGFHKVAKDTDGRFSNSKLRKYLNDKMDEYKNNIKNILKDFDDVEPIIVLENGDIVKKSKTIPPEKIDSVFEEVIPRLEEDIKELYMFAIGEAEDRQKRYFEILNGEDIKP